LQRLFNTRGLTCTQYIQALRLERAQRLITWRNRMNTGEPLRNIAYLCGFRDYNYFARLFRRRFGHAPGEVVDDTR
jgi:AraC family transcriptional regulator, positive regulator of tynA and feaB